MTDPAADLLAEAINKVDEAMDDLPERMWEAADAGSGPYAAALLTHPRLRAALGRGLALLECEEALPEGWVWRVCGDHRLIDAWAWPIDGSEEEEVRTPGLSTPTEALRALTAKLRERER